MASLDDDKRAKLVRVLAMLGAPRAEDRATAAAAVAQFVKQLGLTWEELLARGAEVPAELIGWRRSKYSARGNGHTRPGSWRRREDGAVLNTREFIRSGAWLATVNDQQVRYYPDRPQTFPSEAQAQAAAEAADWFGFLPENWRFV